MTMTEVCGRGILVGMLVDGVESVVVAPAGSSIMAPDSSTKLSIYGTVAGPLNNSGS